MLPTPYHTAPSSAITPFVEKVQCTGNADKQERKNFSVSTFGVLEFIIAKDKFFS